MQLPDNILEGLSEKQREAVEYIDSHLLIFAGAGSGKTRVLTHKIAWLIKNGLADPKRVVAMTFTNKAANEMRERLSNLVAKDQQTFWAGTFHSFGLRFLIRNIRYAEDFGVKKGFAVAGSEDSNRIIREVMTELHPELAKSFKLPDIIGAVSKEYTSYWTPEVPNASKWRFDDIAKEYRNRLRQYNLVDYDDLMMLPVFISTANKEVIAKERKYIEWLLVDEYQDVNTPQFWLLKILTGPNCKLIVVGDPDQAIYGWRGANIDMILNFESRDFRSSKTIVLDYNYRSTRNILDASNAVIKHNELRKEKNLVTDREAGDKIQLHYYSYDEDEANGVVDEIIKLHNETGRKYGDFAILYRINAESAGFEQVLKSKCIPYKIIKGQSYFSRKEVVDVISILRIAINPEDTKAFERVTITLIDGFGKKKFENLEKFIGSLKDKSEIWDRLEEGRYNIGVNVRLQAKLAEFAQQMKWIIELLETNNYIAIISFILNNMGYDEYLQNKYADTYADRHNNVMELLSVIDDSVEPSEALSKIALMSDADSKDDDDNAVKLMTVHSAKGLEFPIVFMVGMEEGVFPSCWADEGEDMEEERRLCYVGMTRAKDKLYMTSAQVRRVHGDYMEEEPSRFLNEIPPELIDSHEFFDKDGKICKELEEGFYDDLPFDLA